MTKKQLRDIDKVVSPLLSQGQFPYQTLVKHPELGLSIHTMYEYIELGLFLGRNIDLERKVKFKPRKCHRSQITDRRIQILERLE